MSSAPLGGGTGVYIPPFLLIDDDAGTASSPPASQPHHLTDHSKGRPQSFNALSTRPVANRHSCIGGFRAGIASARHSLDSQTFQQQPAGACSAGSSFITPVARRSLDSQTFQQQPAGACSAGSSFITPVARRSLDSQTFQQQPPAGVCSAGSSFITPVARRNLDSQTFQQQPPAGACSAGSSCSASACWDLTLAPPWQSGASSSFSGSPVQARLCGCPATAVQPMAAAAQGPYSDDELDKIDCCLQQLLARRQALLQGRAAAAGTAPGPIPMMPAPPQQAAMMPQQLAASQAMCDSGLMFFTPSSLLGSGDAMAAVLLEEPGSKPPAPTHTEASFCMPGNLPSAALAPFMPAGLASPAAAMLPACAILPPVGLQQVTTAQDKLLELFQMQQLEAALTDDLRHLLPMCVS